MSKLAFLFVILISLFSPFLRADNVDIQELQNAKRSAEQAIQQIQQKFSVSKEAEKVAPIADLEKWRERALRLFNDKRFTWSVNQLVSHPQRSYVLLTQLAVIIFMIFFRAWRRVRAPNFLWRIWVGLYCFVLQWGLVLFVIPIVMFGEPYKVFLQSIREALF